MNASILLEVGDELRSEHLPEIRRQLAEARRAHARVRVDLTHVKQMDRDAILFFATGEGRAIEIAGCPRHVRQWIRCEARQHRAMTSD